MLYQRLQIPNQTETVREQLQLALQALGQQAQHRPDFVAVLATGFVLFTLLVNGLTLRPVIRLLQLDRLSPLNQALRNKVLALSLADVRDRVSKTAEESSDWVFMSMQDSNDGKEYDSPVAKISALSCLDSKK